MSILVLLLACTHDTRVLAESDPPADTGAVADSGGTDDTQELSGTRSRCQVGQGSISCSHETAFFDVQGESRAVHYQVPVGEPPADGWPVAVMFQPSYVPAEHFFSASEGDAFGLWYQVSTVQALLDGGYAVVAPDAAGQGTTYWDTNIYPWNADWQDSPDADLMGQLLHGVADGTFGKLDPHRLFAAGMSSGGYMTSRMAVSYGGHFRALAVHSASYATCIASTCTVPALPADHPPTLFLHGEKDDVVPLWTMQLYQDALEQQGTTTQVILDEDAGHEWIPAAPGAIVAWFDRYDQSY